MSNKSGNLKVLLGEKTCPVCGKKYFCRTESVYKYRYKGKQKQCCSYSCWVKKLKELGKW